MTKRLKPNERKQQLVHTALTVAESNGLSNVTYQSVARAAGVTIQTVQLYYPTKCQLMRDLMRLAIRNECLAVVAEGLATRCQHASKAPDELRKRAIQWLGVNA